MVFGQFRQVLRLRFGSRTNQATSCCDSRQLNKFAPRNSAQENLLPSFGFDDPEPPRAYIILIQTDMSRRIPADETDQRHDGKPVGDGIPQLSGHKSVNVLTITPSKCLRAWPLLHNKAKINAQAKNIDIVTLHSQIAHRPARLHQPLAAALAALLIHCGSAVAASSPDVHYYTISIDYTLSRLWVEARFSPTVDSVTARSRDAGKFLIDARNCDSSEQIRMRNRRMLLPAKGIRCMNYTVDLERAARQERHNRNLLPGNVIVSPSLWLWRPELTARTELRVRFRLPENVRVSVPWEVVNAERQEYRVAKSPESSNATAVFGDFDYKEVKIPGAVLRVGLLKTEGGMDTEAITNWLRATAADVSLAYGRFPNPSPQVVVIPVGNTSGRGDSAVPFGRVIRDGGETIELLIDQSRPIEDFLEDWTATHEFSHLLLPYMQRNQNWVSEGFAQYYQNILLARSGTYDELKAWQKIYQGLERGRQSRPEMSPNEAAAGSLRGSLMKVYWSGAALALMADVGLRELSGGEETLDLVLDRLQQCCLPSDHVWSGPELFAKMDSLTRFPVFMRLYRRYANTAGFPDVLPLFGRLGLSVSNGTIRLRRHAELAGIRSAITELDTAAADWRHQLAANQ